MDGCYLKVRRAEEHLNTLKQLIGGLLNDYPISVETEIDPDTGERFWWIAEEPAQPPEWWSPILGDFLYNLRSSLDHLAWQLVLRSGGIPTNGTEFPIFRDPGKYASKDPRKLAGMQPEIVAAVDAAQPCNRVANPLAHPLWWLQDLGNIDKHQELHLIIAAAEGGFFVPPLPGNLVFEVRPYTGRLQRETELLRMPPEQVHVQYGPIFGIEVDIPDAPIYRRNLVYLLDSISAEARATLSGFRRFF